MNVSLKHLLLAIFAIVGVQACGGCKSECDSSLPFPEPGSCGIPGAAQGTPGGSCGMWTYWNGCDDDLVCISGVCIPCGKKGSTCCSGATCTDGTTFCAQDPGKADLCTDSCGVMAGMDCCPGNQCSASLQCNLNTKQCEPKTADPCNGSSIFVFKIKDPNGCGYNLTVTSTSASNAQMCASLQTAGSGLEVLGASNDLPQIFEYCNESPFSPDSQVQVSAWSKQDADQCAHSMCLNCTTTEGKCPPN